MGHSLEAMRSEALRQAGLQFDTLIAHAESHIEAIFTAALRLCGRGWERGIGDESDAVWRLAILRGAEAISGLPHTPIGQPSIGIRAFCIPQFCVRVQSRLYRLDYAFFAKASGEDGDVFRVAVELDGHDFHERTKAQALADRSRDRALTRAGWRVLRFTGSEVVSDPFACALEVHELLNEFCLEAELKDGA